MATKIKRSLYIGLGGTGMSALLNAKKMFTETYGEVPPMIGFLGIDTDGGAYKKEADSKMGKIRLEPFEQFSIQVKEPKPYYQVNQDHFSWLPSQNLFALQSMMLGAGQVRTNGRFAVVYNYVNLANQIRKVVDRIANAKIAENPKYELANSEVEIHAVFSVCGGTGCGTFLDVAYLLRQVMPNRRITGYAVLPDVFVSMGNGNASMARVKPNAYGAILDLDWLMHLTMDSKPITLDYVSVPLIETNENPFNTVYFIDNRNANGDVYDHIDQLTDMISLALVTSAGELSSAAASVSDNVEKMIAAGTMDVKGKKAWCAGMGVCEILFRGSELRDLYARKAVKRLAERLQNNCIDAAAIVDTWIDSDDVKIRESVGNEHDDVIDYLLSLNAPYQFSDVDDKANAGAEVNDYLNGPGMSGQEKIDGRLQSLKKRVYNELHKLVVKTINQECGVGGAEAVLQNLLQQVDIFLSEMNEEYQKLQETHPFLVSSKDNAVQDLSDYYGRFFKLKSRVDELTEDVMDAVQRLCANRRDALRHSHAISFFTGLKQEIQVELRKVIDIKLILSTLSEACTNSIVRISNLVNRESQIFQIDLAKEFISQVAVADEDLLISDLMKELPGNKIYDFADKRSEEVMDMLLGFTSKIKTAQHWENTSIDQILDKMDQRAFDHVIKMAISKSKPLIQYNDRGYRPEIAPTDAYYIGVPDKLNSRLARKDYFKNQLDNQATTVDFANIGISDRVIIYRQFGVFPAFHIASLLSYKAKYDNSNVSCHFDENLKNRMLRESFSIEPQLRPDDSLALWVQGFIFGLIKNEDGMYSFQNEEEGDALFDFWMPLGEYRDDAYNEFKKHLDIIRDHYEDYLESEAKKHGSEFVENLIRDVKANYYDKFSQINMQKQELQKKGFERVRTLITDELNFVRKEL